MSGQSPAEADCNLLDTVRKVEHYGIHTRPAKKTILMYLLLFKNTQILPTFVIRTIKQDGAGLKLGLAVAHSGIIIYQGNAKINSFSWARIRKLSFKRKRFIVKLHPETCHTEEYVFESRDECKSFWKQCIEHHAFFRCQAVKKPQHRRGRMVSKGSSFR
ncbi:FERM PH domain protein [Fasciolopsis buskii]|uniref:FERM PH domain protein n=1 Tax=Fasciolopsis buskii TaxID=27845 RepID=A0A8E0RW42_9TREM|nr:FERM PH domain protein [Fasciolopsis buski]